jgi:hypothetical protein
MELSSVEAIFRELNTARARYLVVGGLAVVAHGYVRLTADIDLVVDLDTDNVMRALTSLQRLDYRSRAPVEMMAFADPRNRAEWVRDKGMRVFSLYSSRHPATEIDLFIEMPFEFEAAYRDAVSIEVAADVSATFISLPDLLRLKREAGRAQDRVDIEKLEMLRRPRQAGPDDDD